MTTHYKTIEAASEAEYKDRGSKFIAYAFPAATIDVVKSRLKALRELHPKAAHHCTAYRMGADGQTFRASDDGEPAGSAGKPILAAIDSRGLTNVAVIVVRYFGGTLLGVPGLIAAYRTATSFALQLTAVVEKPVMKNLSISFDYTLQGEVMQLIKKHEAVVVQNESGLFSKLHIDVPLANWESFKEIIVQLQGVEIELHPF
jgi:uncharacterized YigZ family protein